jgi:hypothetical protein
MRRGCGCRYPSFACAFAPVALKGRRHGPPDDAGPGQGRLAIGAGEGRHRAEVPPVSTTIVGRTSPMARSRPSRSEPGRHGIAGAFRCRSFARPRLPTTDAGSASRRTRRSAIRSSIASRTPGEPDGVQVRLARAPAPRRAQFPPHGHALLRLGRQRRVPVLHPDPERAAST